MDRYKLTPEIARYLTDNVGIDLYQLHGEMEKLRTYVGDARPSNSAISMFSLFAQSVSGRLHWMTRFWRAITGRLRT